MATLGRRDGFKRCFGFALQSVGFVPEDYYEALCVNGVARGAFMAMTTAILTLPLRNNYGGLLQAVALYKAIGQCGHDPVWLDKSAQITTTKAFFAEVLAHVPGQDIRHLRSRNLAVRRHREWLEAQMPRRSHRVATSAQLASEVDRLAIDNVIVGSDQVWRLEFQGDGNENNYFLGFGPESMGRISYAASFGGDQWRYPERVEEVSRLLSRFSAISVREKSGLTICQDAFGCNDARLVLDPTLLHDASFYQRLIEESGEHQSTRSGAVVVYALDHKEKAEQIAQDIARRKGGLDVETLMIRSREYLSVTQWLAKFEKADFVITDSYHGSIFAIMFRKPFISLANRSRGLDRFATLLTMLGLESRLLYDFSEPRDYGEFLDLDFSEIDKPLEDARTEARAFLQAALDECSTERFRHAPRVR